MTKKHHYQAPTVEEVIVEFDQSILSSGSHHTVEGTVQEADPDTIEEINPYPAPF